MKPDRRNPIVRLLIPQYNELALFLMSIAFVLLFFTHSDLRAGSHEILFKSFDPRTYVALVLFVLGILFSLYHVFTTRLKTDWEKIAMLFFAVMANGFSGVAAGMHMLEDSHGLLMVFPIWNIVNGVLLLFMYRFNIIDESSILDDNATLFQVILGMIVVVTTFAVCRFVFEMYWAITFSICVAYASNVNGTVQDVFSGSNRYKKHNNTIKIDLK
jgi:uncharacterized membrane protein (DUF106 family)